MMPSVIGLAPSAKRHLGSSFLSTQGFSSTRSILISASVEPVEGARIVIEDALDHALVDAAVLLQQPQRLDLRRCVGMTVIGADDEIVGTAVSQDVGQVIRALTGDIHVVGL